MIYSCIEPVVDTQRPQEQASFCQGRSAGDHITLLTKNIEDGFQLREKVGVVLLDLTAAYDTVWHHGLHLKLLWSVPDCSLWKCYQTAASDGQCSKLRRLRSGVPQGSVLSLTLFKVSVHDFPKTRSRKYGYADHVAIMVQRPTWKAIKDSQDQGPHL